MGKTSIEWTDFSVNPIRARDPSKPGSLGHYCELLSPGCAHCYASRMQPRFGMPRFPGAGKLATLPVVQSGEPDFVRVKGGLEVFLATSVLDEVLARKKPTRFFWCDMTDLFGSWVPDAWIDACWATMALSHWHTHQVLTKRAVRMRGYLADPSRRNKIAAVPRYAVSEATRLPLFLREYWPLPNVQCGVSVEDQKLDDERTWRLLGTPAAVRFLSMEPLLGPVDLDRDFRAGVIDWVIVGGESGPRARPMHPDWVRSIRDQCTAAGVPFFFKQWGEWAPCSEHPLTEVGQSQAVLCVKRDGGGDRVLRGDGRFTGEAPQIEDAWMARVGKKKAGRLLDGREWSEFPRVEVPA